MFPSDTMTAPQEREPSRLGEGCVLYMLDPMPSLRFQDVLKKIWLEH